MKKIPLFTSFVLLLIAIGIYFGGSYIDFYNVELLHPLFVSLIPLILLFFSSSFFKILNTKYFFTTIVSFSILDCLWLSTIQPLCSQIGCLDRTQSALILSSLFSIIYFIILLIQNRKAA
jgi:hypothetical protein